MAHPGGRANEQFSVNAYEAAGRCQARFQGTGHTPGTMILARIPPSGDSLAQVPYEHSRRHSRYAPAIGRLSAY